MAEAPKAPKRSIVIRILVGFVVVLLSFGAVSTASLLQHERTARTLRLLHEGYLPLSLSISESRATQGAFATMVERSFEGPESAAAEGWLEVARRVRPIALRRALDTAVHALKLVQNERDERSLLTLHAELEAVLLEYELSEDDFESLTASLSTRDVASARAALATIRTRERQAQTHLSRAWSLISERIASTSRHARDDERRAFGLLVGLGLVALAVTIGIAFWSTRMLAPLTRLAERVAAVARGDLSTRLGKHADDEIGHVAAEFERMVDALNARDARLRQTERLAAVGRLAAHVTHEVRNPLNSIRLNVEMLEEDLSEGLPESRKIAASVLAEVDRLTAITEQYLRLARLPDPKLVPADLAELVREVSSFVDREMAQAGIHVDLALEPVSPVPMDEGQLRQALLNLVRNAREAMPEGGRVRIELQPRGEGVLLSITDEGPGIAEAERDKIFDLFYTTKQHGTGLGLPLTQQIILAHGGKLECSAVEGGGTRFSVFLPANRGERLPEHRPHPTAQDALDS